MPAVVSDSSPFVYLARIERFDLLRRLYTTIYIPDAVWREVAVDGGTKKEAQAVRAGLADGWIQIEAVGNPSAFSDRALLSLDPGEREAIMLATEKKALLIIDELDGRKVAMRMGIQLTGTIGILIEAKLRGYVSELRSEFAKLERETNFRVAPPLLANALKRVGEPLT